VSCDHCHREITPGTERTVLGGVKHWVRVCALCFPFVASIVFGQTSPPEKAPPVMISVGNPGIYGNASAQTLTNTSARRIVLDLPAAELSRQHWRLSKADFQLSPADKARLRSLIEGDAEVEKFRGR
jgi:hypothetical protein